MFLFLYFFYFQEQLEAFDKQFNGFLDYLFGPRDTRVRGWFMLDSCLPTMSLTLLYLLIVWLGTIYMKNRPAYSLKGVLIAYNFSVTMLSLYMLIELIASTWEGAYNLQCQNLHSAGEADTRVAKVLWWYYFSKLIEFLDTIFFVLRKKNNQITFLHVYHHASMFNIWWCVLNWIPCGQSFFGPTLNSFIHVLMYSYYGLSTIPSMHKYLWWKKYLTQAQLIQFLLTITHTLSAAVVPCGFPMGCLMFQSSYMATLVILFLNFYVQTYKKKLSKEDGWITADIKDIKNGYHNGYTAATNGSTSKQKAQ
ncbi:elongation of very long chain fatty acids protein 2-like [Huso huso]|uniref:Elongation of very long chain fatty acids protein 2 n=1 Tax=Huso huso TaxID=61971 RepID=A0ABR1A469_HUSHU